MTSLDAKALAEELREDIRDGVDITFGGSISELIKHTLVQEIVESLVPKLDALTSCHFCGARNDLTKCAAGCDDDEDARVIPLQVSTPVDGD